jgi:integrase
LHPDTITDLFRKHCVAAGLPRIRLHDVRHSYATAALKGGVSPKTISERLGHSSAAFTLQAYTHVVPGMDELAASTVADLILRPFLDRDGHENGHKDADETSADDKKTR